MNVSTKKTRLVLTLGIAALSVLGLLAAADRSARAAKPEGQTSMLAHMVYFTLNESTAANRRKLVEACDKYLSDHPGTVFYGAGTVADLDREVNDRDYDVGLHVVFKDRASHDAYQVAAKHLQFIKENKDGWKKVRVFDTDVSPSSASK
jgi:hypothetical protein